MLGQEGMSWCKSPSMALCDILVSPSAGLSIRRCKVSPALTTGNSPPPLGVLWLAPGSLVVGHIPAPRPAAGPEGCHRIL